MEQRLTDLLATRAAAREAHDRSHGGADWARRSVSWVVNAMDQPPKLSKERSAALLFYARPTPEGESGDHVVHRETCNKTLLPALRLSMRWCDLLD